MLVRSIRGRLLFATLPVVLIFAVCGSFAIYQTWVVASRTRHFVGAHLATDNLLMGIRLEVESIVRTVMLPPPDLDAAGYARDARSRLDDYSSKLKGVTSPLVEGEAARALLSRLSRLLETPLLIYHVPGEAMEVADASAMPLMATAHKLGSVPLANAIAEMVMAFNDILITGDEAERRLFDRKAAYVEGREDFPRYREEFRSFKAKGEAVFESAHTLSRARAEFLDAGNQLSATMARMAAEFERTVLLPEEVRVQHQLKTILRVLLAAMAVGTAAALLVGFQASRSFSRPLVAMVEMLRALENGERGRRLRMHREDELGRMASAMDRFADRLEENMAALEKEVVERSEAQADLQISEGAYKKLSQQFQVLLDGIPDRLTLLTPDFKVGWSNRAASESLVGDQSQCLFAASIVKACFSRGRVEDGVEATPDGRLWGVKVFPLKNSAEEVTGVIRLASDITERRRLQDEATAASRLASLGELSAGVAHEINNPNGLILLNAPLLIETYSAAAEILDARFQTEGDFILGRMPYSLLRDELPERYREVLEGANRIKRIVEDLKRFASPEPLDLCAGFNLNEVVHASVRLLAHLIKNSTDHFTMDLAGDLPEARGSFQQVEQVVVNLVQNACQALSGREKGVHLVTRFDSATRCDLLEIRDQGCGIRAENLSQITDPFFTTRRETGGTGLGLSVSTRIVREHGGRLTFDSIPGRGTTAILALPALTQEEV
jgi:signal transduction histidine kinase/HAMP domain-containing protein